MSDQESKQRDRSPNYPYISLRDAMERAQQFYDAEKRGAAAVPVLAKDWNYSPKSSGLIQTIAALKSYGLMEEEGRGTDRRVKLSELALRILLDQRPDSLERADWLQRAARMPGVAQKILEKFPNDLPSDHNLEHFLIFDLKFNPESAKGAVKLFKENATFTGLYDVRSISPFDGIRGESMEVTPVTVMTPGRTVQPVSVKSERIIGPDGDIVLQFAGEPSWETYDFLESYIKLRKGVLKPGGVARATAEIKKPEKEEEASAKPSLRRTA